MAITVNRFVIDETYMESPMPAAQHRLWASNIYTKVIL